MERARLGGEKPDYHTLLASMTQICDGLLLKAWQIECGYTTLDQFAKAKPTREQLTTIATRIIINYTTPALNHETTIDESESESDSDASSESGTDAEKSGVQPSVALPQTSSASSILSDDDIAYQNLRLLTRDLLYLKELIRAISDGDIGRVEDFLPQLTMMFGGAGGNNYCTEILHFILDLKHVCIKRSDQTGD